MRHPFEKIAEGNRARVFLPLLVLTLVLTVALNIIAAPLKTSETPLGVISFELAGDAATAARMIGSWDESARSLAAFSLGLDYLYLFGYSTTLGMACVWAASVFRRRGILLMASTGVALAWGQWLAGLFDATENTALITMLLGSALDAPARIAWWCAVIKFALVVAAFIYVALGAVVRLWATLSKPQTH